MDPAARWVDYLLRPLDLFLHLLLLSRACVTHRLRDGLVEVDSQEALNQVVGALDLPHS